MKFNLIFLHISHTHASAGVCGRRPSHWTRRRLPLWSTMRECTAATKRRWERGYCGIWSHVCVVVFGEFLAICVEFCRNLVYSFMYTFIFCHLVILSMIFFFFLKERMLTWYLFLLNLYKFNFLFPQFLVYSTIILACVCNAIMFANTVLLVSV